MVFRYFIGHLRNPYPTRLFYALLWDFTHTKRYLIKRGASVNVAGRLYGSPLQAASAHGHVWAMAVPFQYSADINLTGGCMGYTLEAAADSAKEDTVIMLLPHKANANLTGGIWNRAIIAASAHSRYERAASYDVYLKLGQELTL